MRVETWAVAGAVLGAMLVWLLGAVDPVVGVLCVAAAAALVAHVVADRSRRAALTARLLLALVYVAIGARNPTALGIVVAIFGVALAALAYASSAQAPRGRAGNAGRRDR